MASKAIAQDVNILTLCAILAAIVLMCGFSDVDLREKDRLRMHRMVREHESRLAELGL